MQYTELILSFTVGILVAILLSVVFSLKIKGIMRLLLNLVAGSLALVVLGLFKVPYFTLSPLSAFVVGLTGVPGLIVIYLIGAFL